MSGPQDPKGAPGRGPAPSGERRVVLVVEDDVSIRDLIVHALRTQYDVHTADDGMQAVQLLDTLRPDLAILDVMMPRMDGFELARLLKSKETLKEIPIIFLSARGKATDVVEGIQAGARFYLAKPFKMTELLDKVARALKS